MSLLDTASLIVTPNGYKEGKLYSVIPSDGSGDLSVTRATTATRVNSAGLVELVPYNLFTYSEQFDNADWSKSSGTITANSTTAPNGTTTADTFTGNGALSNHDFFEGFTGGANTTASIYVKKNTAQFVYISLNYQSSGVNWATGVYDLDNLTTATFQSGGVTNQVATITDEGNGWRRITLSVDTANTTLFCMYGLSNSMSPTLGSRGRVENSSSQSFYAWGAQVVEGSTAKDYQKTETRLNIPRLDYSNGTCPSLLVEPQRTNIVTWSSSFDNAVWSKENNGSGTLPVITANYATAPDGTMSADRAQFTNIGGSGSGSNYSLIYQLSLALSATGTATIYLKSNTSSNQEVLVYWSGGQGDVFEVTPEWQRFTLSNLTAATSGFVLGTRGGSGSFFNGGDEVLDILVWGAQLEAGSYATSYIPTTSASVTRNADLVTKTSATALIGQTEGTLFVDAYITGKDSSNGSILFATDKVSSGALIRIIYTSTNALRFDVFDGSSFQCLISAGAYNVGDRVKVAGGYKNNDFVMYVNGTQIGTDTSGSVPATDTANINTSIYGDTNGSFVNAAALWKTRLTNTQLAQLTTI